MARTRSGRLTVALPNLIRERLLPELLVLVLRFLDIDLPSLLNAIRVDRMFAAAARWHLQHGLIRARAPQMPPGKDIPADDVLSEHYEDYPNVYTDEMATTPAEWRLAKSVVCKSLIDQLPGRHYIQYAWARMQYGQGQQPVAQLSTWALGRGGEDDPTTAARGEVQLRFCLARAEEETDEYMAPAIERRARVGENALCADLYTESSEEDDSEGQYLCRAVVGKIDPCTLSFPLRGHYHEMALGTSQAMRFLPPGLQIRVPDGTGDCQTLITRWGDVEVARIIGAHATPDVTFGTWHLMRAYDEPIPFVDYPATKQSPPWGAEMLWSPEPPEPMSRDKAWSRERDPAKREPIDGDDPNEWGWACG